MDTIRCSDYYTGKSMFVVAAHVTHVVIGDKSPSGKVPTIVHLTTGETVAVAESLVEIERRIWKAGEDR